jgi:hypothetical protein
VNLKVLKGDIIKAVGPLDIEIGGKRVIGHAVFLEDTTIGISMDLSFTRKDFDAAFNDFDRILREGHRMIKTGHSSI